MTAEIALINRTAVTLAADSAMTLSGGGNLDKIYNSAEKIFELSTHDPIGIMIYNGLHFMGVPFDVAIKQFRESVHCTKFSGVNDAADAFFLYLRNVIGASHEVQNAHVTQVVGTIFGRLRAEFDIRIEKMIITNRGKPPKGFDPHALFVLVVTELLEPLRERVVAEGFDDTTAENIGELYKDAIMVASKNAWSPLPLDDDDQTLLMELAALVLHRDIITSSFTGVVFAGYGSKDIFPSIVSYELDGMVADRLKCRKKEPVVIDRDENTAEIVPFAQHDMADRFLYGIDPDVEGDIANYLGTTLRQAGTSIIAEGPKARKKNLTRKLERSIDIAVQEFKDAGLREIKDRNKKLILDMVSFMPKQELANFAESLVNITSIKRRVSAEQETVGGPIDVAVISRSDGFVWVKRKHYFDPALNPRFFARKYGLTSTGGFGGKS